MFQPEPTTERVRNVAGVRVRASVVAVATAAVTLGLSATASALPIADAGTPSLPNFSGAAATAKKVKDPTKAPQNPFMAANPNSNIHNDTWMTDAYQRSGPLGDDLQATSGATPPSLCGSISFDTQGRLLSVCPSSVSPPVARIVRPEHARGDLRAHPADRPEPARDQGVPELHRGRLLLPRRREPDVGPDQDRPHLRPQRGRRRQDADAREGLRPDRGPRPGDRAHHLRAARLQRPDLVRLQDRRQDRHAQHEDRRDQGQDHERGDRELVRGRRGRRLHRLRQAHVPVQGDEEGHPADRLAEGLSELRDREAEPGQRRLRHDPDDHGERPGRDHRQRRSDERRRLPQQARPSTRARSGSCASSPSSRRAPARPRTR